MSCNENEEWYPEKLSTLLSAFEGGIMLTYGDADVVDKDPAAPSKPNGMVGADYDNLKQILFAVNERGVAGMFRANLLNYMLPFPQEIGVKNYGQWVICVSLAKGKLRHLKKGLHRYHRISSLGTENPVSVASRRFLPGLSKVVRWLKTPSSIERDLGPLMLVLNNAYNDSFAYPVLLARILRMRIGDLSRKKMTVLDQFIRLEISSSRLFVKAIAHRLFERSALRLEWDYMRSVMAHRALNYYYHKKRKDIYQKHIAELTAQPSFDVAAEGTISPTDDILYDMTGFIRRTLRPLSLALSSDNPRRVNIIMATIDFTYIFGGYLAMFNLALAIRKCGYATRIIIVEPCNYNPAAWKREIAHYPGLEDLFDLVETSYHFDRTIPLAVSKEDIFIATSCWTAHVAHQAALDMGRERFIFFAQEYEPIFYPMSSTYALANQAYTFPQYTIFSTELLREFFEENRLGPFTECNEGRKENTVCFRNAVNVFPITESTMSLRKRKKFLYYARPERHAARNMFELGILGLSAAIEDGLFDLDQWEFHGIGSVGGLKKIRLHEGVVLKLMPKTSLNEYLSLLPTYDLGLSLMLSPHPSLVPIDMASAGLVTVTNTFLNKTRERWLEVSSNIVAVPPTVEGIKAGLAIAIGEVGNYSKRIAGSKVNWPTSWKDAFNDEFMSKLKGFIDSP